MLYGGFPFYRSHSVSQCSSRKIKCIVNTSHTQFRKEERNCTCLEYVLSGSSGAFHVQQALEYLWRALKLDVNWTFNETSSILSKRTSHQFFPLGKRNSIEKHLVRNIVIQLNHQNKLNVVCLLCDIYYKQRFRLLFN